MDGLERKPEVCAPLTNDTLSLKGSTKTNNFRRSCLNRANFIAMEKALKEGRGPCERVRQLSLSQMKV